MRTRIVVSVVVMVLALGLWWFVGLQNGTSLPSFAPGDIFTAKQLKAMATQAEANAQGRDDDNDDDNDDDDDDDNDNDDDDDDDIFTFTSTLSRAQEIPAPSGGTLSRGELTLRFNPGLTRVDATLTLEGSNENTTRAHLHCNRAGLTGPIPIGFVDPGPCDLAQLQEGDLKCRLTNEDFIEPAASQQCFDTAGRSVNNIAALFFAIREGLIYVNIHTVENESGEIRGQLIGED
jgi:CHRD domain